MLCAVVPLAFGDTLPTSDSFFSPPFLLYPIEIEMIYLYLYYINHCMIPSYIPFLIVDLSAPSLMSLSWSGLAPCWPDLFVGTRLSVGAACWDETLLLLHVAVAMLACSQRSVRGFAIFAKDKQWQWRRELAIPKLCSAGKS